MEMGTEQKSWHMLREIPKGTCGWQRRMSMPQAISSGDSVSSFIGTMWEQHQNPL